MAEVVWHKSTQHTYKSYLVSYSLGLCIDPNLNVFMLLINI